MNFDPKHHFPPKYGRNHKKYGNSIQDIDIFGINTQFYIKDNQAFPMNKSNCTALQVAPIMQYSCTARHACTVFHITDPFLKILRYCIPAQIY